MNTRSKLAADQFYNWQLLPMTKDRSNTYTFRSAISHLRKNYLNPKSGVSFSGVNRIYQFYDKVIPIKIIKEFLSYDDSYTLHAKSFKKRYNPSFIKYKGQQMQADLIDVGNLSHENGGIKFLLTIICSFTKKAWIHPIKSKKSDVVLHAFKTLLKQIPKTPRSILMDAGGEFILVRKWCAENNIKTYLPYTSFHGSFIERFNQTIKNRLYKWMDANKSEKYLNSLEKLLEGYNNAEHSSIGTTPNIAWSNKNTHPMIRERLQNYYDKFTKTKPKLKIGDIVRIKLLPKSSFHKGYEIQNNQELFQIHKILTNLPIPMYQLQSMEKPEEGVIKGHFYGHELTLVSKNSSK